jgi:hypothetical protein
LHANILIQYISIYVEDIPMGLAVDQDDRASVQEFQQWAIFRRSGRQSAGLLPPWSSQRPSESAFEQQGRRSIQGFENLPQREQDQEEKQEQEQDLRNNNKLQISASVIANLKSCLWSGKTRAFRGIQRLSWGVQAATGLVGCMDVGEIQVPGTVTGDQAQGKRKYRSKSYRARKLLRKLYS